MEFYRVCKRKKISFSILFQLSYWVVFFQIDILINFFNFSNDGLLEFFFINEETRKTSIILSQLALIVFLLGNIVSDYTPNFKQFSNLKSLPKFNLDKIEYFTGFLLVLYILMSGDMILGEYTPNNTISGRGYIHRLFQIFFLSNLILRLYESSNFKNLPFSTKIVISSYGLLSLFIGDRGPLIVIALIFLLFYMRNKKILIFRFIFFGFISVLLLSFIGSVRQLRFVDSSYSNRIGTVLSNFSNNSGENGIAEGGFFELAKSGRCLPAAIDYKKDVTLPLVHFQKMYILSSIPFLGGVYLEAFDLDPQIYSSSSSLISYHLQGGNVTYGNGTSIIADLFLDLGFYGTLFIMFLFGFFIKSTENEFYKNQNLNIYSLIYIILFSVSIYLPRSALLMQLEKIVFIFIFILFLGLIKKQLNYK